MEINPLVGLSTELSEVGGVGPLVTYMAQGQPVVGEALPVRFSAGARVPLVADRDAGQRVPVCCPIAVLPVSVVARLLLLFWLRRSLLHQRRLRASTEKGLPS
jgi:hypothetical protein